MKNIFKENIYNINKKRYPIITIMGHVDHGKTSILEFLKKSNISINEKRGITQTIKAYQIDTKNGIITFLDTPGHDYFIKMRENGAKITDIIILVISADDGVKKQTIESINYINNFNIPLIIVINKIDKGLNNINNIKKDLSKFNLISKEWGGEYKFIYLSTRSKYGFDDLLNEIYEKIKCINLNIINDKKYLNAFVIESFLDNKKGPVLYSLIKNGFIEIGDYIVYGDQYGKVKFIQNEFGNKINYTITSLPIYIYGINKLPLFQENNNILIANSLKEAKLISENNKKKYIKNNYVDIDINVKDSYDNSYKEIDNYKINYILKVDTNGSYYAIKSFIDNLSDSNKKIIKIIDFKIGHININDIMLSYYSKSKLIGFNIKINNKELKIIKNKNIFFKNYFIIYDLIKLIEDDINKYLLKLENNNYSKGLGEICNIFSSSKNKIIIGCKIKDGRIKNSSDIKILRDNDLLIYNGPILSLRYLKNNILEALKGTECGISIKGNYNFKKNDIIKSN